LEGNILSETVVFNTIVANGMETNKGIFVGQNSASNWVTHNKNQGLGVSIPSLSFNIFILLGNVLKKPMTESMVSDNDYYAPSSTTQV
jgi:hypothetical protein